jgi:CheY-like chemotaxis protein
MRVLLVDDEPNVRMVIRRLLRRQLNVDIEECQNGLEAIERLSREPFDLVLLDVSMPVMDGIDVLQAIRQSPTLNALPVIMITAAASEETVRRALGEGVSDFLAKPIRPELLCQRVERVVKLIEARKTSPATRAPFEPLDCGDARPILIADGSAEFRRFFASAVGSLSPVRQAESGLDALQQCLTSPPYAVFIGSHLGVLGEEMLARKIRALDRCSSVRIVGVKPDHEILAARKSMAYEAVIKRSAALDLFMEGLSAVLRTGTSSSPVLEVVPDLKLLLISAAKESLTRALGDHVILRAPRTRADAS